MTTNRPAIDVLDDLRCAAAILRASGSNRVGYVAEAFERFAEGKADLLALLGLEGQVGQRSAQTQSNARRRAEALRSAAKEFFPGRRTAAQSDQIASAMLRYATSAWSRDSKASTCPVRYAGHLNAHLWSALKADPRVPSARTIRRILATK